MTAVPRRLLEARRRHQLATAQRAVLSHRRLRRTTCLTTWLARQPMRSSRLARAERVRLTARYIPTCGGLAARLRPSELPRAARSNPNPDVPSSSGRPVSLPSPTLPPPLLPSPPPPSDAATVGAAVAISVAAAIGTAALTTAALLPQATLALTLAPQPSPRGSPSPSPRPRPQLNAARCRRM